MTFRNFPSAVKIHVDQDAGVLGGAEAAGRLPAPPDAVTPFKCPTGRGRRFPPALGDGLPSGLDSGRRAPGGNYGFSIVYWIGSMRFRKYSFAASLFT